MCYLYYFNPHEREARDKALREIAWEIYHFNPHEREARDWKGAGGISISGILIHTSVKLVTCPVPLSSLSPTF